MHTTHGLYGTSTYNIWASLRQRCDNPKHISYKYYGAKGISYDPKWNTLEGFIEDMGECPIGYSIERIDNDKNYCKSNCKWIPLGEQAQNRTNSHMFTYQGKTQTLGRWCKELNINYQRTWYRIFKHHMSFEKAIIPERFYR